MRVHVLRSAERISWGGGSGGRGGIRTRDTVSRMHAFQACALNHSATLPGGAHPSEACPVAQPGRRPGSGPIAGGDIESGDLLDARDIVPGHQGHDKLGARCGVAGDMAGESVNIRNQRRTIRRVSRLMPSRRAGPASKPAKTPARKLHPSPHNMRRTMEYPLPRLRYRLQLQFQKKRQSPAPTATGPVQTDEARDMSGPRAATLGVQNIYRRTRNRRVLRPVNLEQQRAALSLPAGWPRQQENPSTWPGRRAF
jgi:hypothetical protein